MDQALRNEIAELRRLSSPEAFAWLVQNRPSLSRSIAHRSWATQEQEALLDYYLSGKIPFSAAHGYEWLLQATSLSRVIKHVTALLPSIPQNRLGLLEYHLGPALIKFASTVRQKNEAQALLAEIRELTVRKGL